MKSKKAAEASMSETPGEIEGSPAEEAKETPSFEEHELKGMVDTLKRAHHIKMDKHKMKAIAPHLKAEKTAVDAIQPTGPEGQGSSNGAPGMDLSEGLSSGIRKKIAKNSRSGEGY